MTIIHYYRLLCSRLRAAPIVSSRYNTPKAQQEFVALAPYPNFVPLAPLP